MADPSPLPLAVVALGGNALLRRGQPATMENQRAAAGRAAAAVAAVAGEVRVVVTHGNGPQVGLLALKEEAYGELEPYPLDVLDAETAGQIGYVVESALDDALPDHEVVTVLTRVVVDAEDPAFGDPVKFIGPGYPQERADELAAGRGWAVRRDGDRWRRVVASPEPRRIVQLSAICSLVTDGFVVVCAGGGGVPIVAEGPATRGVEAVVDKDLVSALLATGLGADLLVLLTDVDALYEGWGTDDARAVAAAGPAWLRERSFAAGSMGPKVEGACRFVEAGGERAAIGRLEDLPALIAGTTGTQVRATEVGVAYRASAAEATTVAG